MRLRNALVLNLAITYCALGQTYTINTIAGGGLPVNVAATSASLGYAPGVAIDSAGNVLVSLSSYNMVVRIDSATGNLTPIAGNGIAGYSGDSGPATSAQLNGPQGIAVDTSGNLYIADANNSVIRKVSNGNITTFAGGGTLVYPNGVGDGGPATGGYLSSPYGVAVDSAGNVYTADTFNNRIRKVSTGGIITTIAGTGYAGFSGDSGLAIGAAVSYPQGIAVDSAGDVYIADTYNSRVRQISTEGIISTLVGMGTPGSSGDNGPAASAQVDYPQGVAVDSAGNLYITDTFNSRVRQVSHGIITTLAAKLSQPVGIVVDSWGHLYVAITGSGLVCEIANGNIATIAGGGAAGGDGPSVGAQLNTPYGVAVDNLGNLYVADMDDGLLREVSNGAITTLAGNLDPHGVAADSAGNLYVANGGTIRKVTAGGAITTVAGTGIYGYSGDNGPATSAQLNEAFGVAVDSIGNLYIADGFNSRVRKVSGGVITTVAGTGVPGYNGDNIPATGAQLSYPSAIAVDAAGNLYIADSGNQSVREVSDGLIMTVAGTRPGTNVGDNQPATYVSLASPSGVAVDDSGNMYVTDSAGARVRRISGGMSETIAGNGVAAFSGDGGSSAGAQVNSPYGIAADHTGTVYIADSGNERIRVLSPSGAPCAYAIDPSSITAVASADGANVVATVQTAAGCGWALQSMPSWITPQGWIVGTGPGSVTLAVAPNSGAARTAVVSLAGLPLVVTQQGAGPAPSLMPGGVVNAASYTAPVAPGSIASAFGNFLLSVPAGTTQSPLPTSISGLSLQINAGAPAPLFFVSAGQANFQIPWEVSGQAQTILAATLNGAGGAAEAVSLAPFAPAIFATNGQGSGQGAILDTSYRLVDSKHPATAGSTYISIYCTGLGGVTHQPPTGSAALSDPLSWTTTVPTVTIGGAQASVSFYGLAPDYAGLYQVNAQVPAGSAKGNAVPVTISIGGATSNSVTMAVQ